MIPVDEVSETQRVLLELAATDTRDPHRALRKILKLDARALGIERVNAWILSASPPAITCVASYSASDDAYSGGQVILARDYPRYFHAVQQEAVIATEDARIDPRTSEFRAGYLEPLGITSLMDVPVWVGGTLAGIVCHEHVGPPRRWTRRDRELALSVGQTVAAVLEAEQGQRAERARQRAAFLSEVSPLLSETLDIDAIPGRLARLAVPMLGDWCVIDVREHDRFRRIAAAHVDPTLEPLLGRGDRDGARPSCRAATEDAIATGDVALVQDPSWDQLRAMCDDDADTRALGAAGARFLLAVPLVVRGQVFGAVGFGAAEPRQDIDQDVELARRLASHAALAISNAKLYRELQEAVSARDEFLSVASHELYTPISALQLALQGLRSGELPDPDRALEIAERQVKRLARLVDELLDVARLRSGRPADSREPVDLTEVVRLTLDDLGDQLRRAGCTVELTAPQPVVGQWERSKLERIVTNLLSNAIKFGPGKPIELSIAAEGDTARLVVRDRGIGIAADKVSRIFDAYQRAVSARQYGGLGLGLYIVRECAEALGGTVRAASELGVGTTFEIELPMAAPSGAGHEP